MKKWTGEVVKERKEEQIRPLGDRELWIRVDDTDGVNMHVWGGGRGTAYL